MNIEIRKLTPELAEDYVHFFDVTPHDDNIDEHKCYCVTWRNDDSYVNLEHWFPTCEERREKALQFVKAGNIEGYLAYCGDEIIGWCNANGNCKACVNFLRDYWSIEEYGTDIKVKSIFCFTINPKIQRMGVATKMLEYICMDVLNDGYDFVEAYVNKNFDDVLNDFRGPLSMYQKCGFCIYSDKGGRVVVRKQLK